MLFYLPHSVFLVDVRVCRSDGMDRLVNDTIDGCNELIGAYSVYPNSGL